MGCDMFKIFSQSDDFGPTGLFTVQSFRYNYKTHNKEVVYTAINLDESTAVKLLGPIDSVILRSGPMPFIVSTSI